MYRVSILIPCYNGEAYIDRAFSSILNQSESEIEVIFVDDGSTDRSLEIANTYLNLFSENGHSLKLYHKSNGGAASAIKEALNISTGKYIMPFDIDDELLPDSCKVQADFLDANSDCGLVLTNGYRVIDNTSNAGLIREDRKMFSKSNIFKGLLLGDIINIPGMYMIRGEFLRDFYKRHQFFKSRFGQNLQLLMPVANEYPAGYIAKPLLKYHINKGSHSNPGSYSKELSNMEGYLDIRIQMLKEIGIASDDYIKLAKQSFYSALLLVDAKYQKRQEYNLHFDKLCSYRTPSIQERMEYYTLNKNPRSLIYRVLLKIRRIIIK